MTAYEETLKDLVSKLKELFQMDQADLDFGIYRVMKAKHDEIDKFLTKDLLPTVKKTLEATGKSQNKQKELDEIISNLRNAGIDPDTSPKVQELKALLENGGSNSENDAKDIFSNLITFFSRYYSGGDFMSLRRYKKDTYSPLSMNGEEVKLHWANADQYYIKSSENLTNYAFVDDPDSTNPLNVKFVLVAATTEQNNNKSQEGERVFTLASESPFEYLSDKNELSIKFEYQVDAKKRKQKDINANIVKHIDELTDLSEFPQWPEIQSRLLSLRSTKANPKRTLIEKHLIDFTAKNKFDYFIHKDLGGFLNKELDYFIKSELVKLDDIIPSAPTELNDLGLLLEKQILTNESQLKKVIALKSIAQKIIQFLAQLESFQKKLWLKKKFVLDSEYLITLDRLIDFPDILDSVFKNQEQLKEWEDIYALDLEKFSHAITSKKIDDFLLIEKYKYLALNTRYLTINEKNTILSGVGNIGDEITGILYNSDNYQTLSLISEKYRNEVKCIYIDPPYNTGGDGFLYKDAFQHSSWLSMMSDRLGIAHKILKEDGVLYASIDAVERTNLEYTLNNTFGPENKVEELIWAQNTTKNQSPTFSTNHEYVEVYAKDIRAVKKAHAMFREVKPGYVEIMELMDELNDDYPPLEYVEKKLKELYKNNKQKLKDEEIPLSEDPWKSIYNYNKVEYRDSEGKFVDQEDAQKYKAKLWVWREVDTSMPQVKQDSQKSEFKDTDSPTYRFYRPAHPITQKPVPTPKTGWRWPLHPNGNQKSCFTALANDHRIVWGQDENKVPQQKSFLKEVETNVAKSVINDYADGEKELRNLFGRSRAFSNPKPTSLIKRFCIQADSKESIIMDFFAGSGTTGDAVIDLNREDSGNRKFILVEMGEYFDTVLLPRILKASYDNNWKDGMPSESPNGTSQFIKYVKLESYEDILASIDFQKNNEQQAALDIFANESMKEEYLLNYSIDFESKNSIFDREMFNYPFNQYIKAVRSNKTHKFNINLIDTFNYLLGLKVCTVREQKGIYEVVGSTNKGEKCLILWRDILEIDSNQLDEWFKKQDYNSRDMEFDLIYVNGDNNLPNLKTGNDHWKVQLIETEFYKLMFDVNEL